MNDRGLYRRRSGPRYRLPDVGQRDDDTAAKEYSPREPLSQTGGDPSRSRGHAVTSTVSRELSRSTRIPARRAT
ncbi:MAG: hypothetical protein J0H22_03570, partial [Actinobacteria bacterium]|nr:hypothetical protein [Actinomycetota bacterium]